MDKQNRDLESGLNDVSIETGDMDNTLLVTGELQERTSRLKTAWGYVKTAGKVLGGIGLTILTVGGTVMGIKSAVGSRGNSENPGNPGNAVDTVKPASLQAAGVARNVAQNQCEVPGDHFLESSIGQCWQDVNEQKFEDIDANIDDLTSKLDVVTEQASKIDTLTADVSGIETRLATAEASIAVHGTDIKDLKDKDTELTEKIAKLVSKDGDLQIAIESLVTKNEELEALIKSLEEKNAALEVKDTELEDLITDLQSDSAEIKEVIEALKAKDVELKDRIDALSGTVSQTQEGLAALEKEFDAAKALLEGDISDLETRVTANESAIAALQAKDTELSEAITSVEEELELAKTELEGKITELDTAVDTRIAEAKKALGDKITEVDGKIDAVQADLQGKIDELTATNSEIAQKIESLEAKDTTLEEVDKGLKDEIAKLVAKDADLQRQIEALTPEAGITNKELQDRIDALVLEDERLQQEIQDLKDKDAQLDTEIADIKRQIEDLVSANELLASDIETLRTKDGELADKDLELEGLIRGLQHRDQELNDSITAIDERIGTLTSNITTMKTELEQRIDSEVTTINSKIDGVQTDLSDRLEALTKENEEFRELLGIVINRLEALENAGTSEEVLERLNTFGGALNSVASAIVGENVTVVDEVLLTESSQTKSAFASLKDSQEGTAKKTVKFSSEGIERIRSKISGMDNKTKWTIGGLSVAGVVIALLTADIVVNIKVKKHAGDEKKGPIIKAALAFFGEKHVHFNGKKIHRDTLKYIGIAAEETAKAMKLYNQEEQTMEKNEEETFKNIISLGLGVLFYFAEHLKERKMDPKEVAKILMEVIKEGREKNGSTVSPVPMNSDNGNGSHGNSGSRDSSDDSHAPVNDSPFDEDSYDKVDGVAHTGSGLVSRSGSEDHSDTTKAENDMATSSTPAVPDTTAISQSSTPLHAPRTSIYRDSESSVPSSNSSPDQLDVDITDTSPEKAPVSSVKRSSTSASGDIEMQIPASGTGHGEDLQDTALKVGEDLSDSPTVEAEDTVTVPLGESAVSGNPDATVGSNGKSFKERIRRSSKEHSMDTLDDQADRSSGSDPLGLM